MNYLTVENLEKSFGEKLLFRDITFGIQEGEKIALIGKNGSGKSTLLEIISEEQFADKGDVIKNNDIRITYLPQQINIDSNLRVLDYMLNSPNPMVKAVKEYEEAILDAKNDTERISKASAKIDELDAWNFESKLKEALSKLSIINFSQKVGELSGGQKRKLALARTLIEDVDLMILDEPTNHLDIEMIEWLEEKLERKSLAILVVSHDRYFLDNICNSFMELNHDKIRQYKGDYEYYLEKKAEIERIEDTRTSKAKNLYKKELEWLRRSPKARTHKSKKREEGVYNLEKKSQKVIREELPDFEMKMSRVGKKILEIQHIHKSFGDLDLIKDFTHTFKRGERVGVVGPNGSGKSTFLRMIMGYLKPDIGKIVYGKTIVFGYFSQQGPDIKDNERVINVVKELAEEIPFGTSSTMSAAQFLRYFGFDDTTQYNYYKNLSGGEKRRLHLIMVLVKNPNFLIMDEPTNDLDIETMTILEDFLQRYNGCLLVATHDRAFLDKITDHIFIFGQGDKIVDFPFSYTEYRQKKKKEEAKEKSKQKKLKNEENSEAKKKSTTKNNKPSYKYVREFEFLGPEIEKLEAEKEELSKKMNSGELDHNELNDVSEKYSEISDKLEEKEMRWLELSEMFE